MDDDDAPISVYSEMYLEAVDHFQYAEFVICIAAARHNLIQPNLPRYHQMKNLILIACAEDDWDAAEGCQLKAERIWQLVNNLTVDSDETRHAMSQRIA